jgi:hypothetical protein
MPDGRPLRSLLLGWGNATSSQLAAYERLHRDLGLDATSVLPSTAAGLFRPTAYVRAVEPVADALLAGTTTIDVVHLFSDNGFIAWAALLERLAAGGEAGARARGRIRGVVYDSSPGLWATTGKVDFARRFARAMTPLAARALGREATDPLPVVTRVLEGAFVAYQVVHPTAVRRMTSAESRIAAAQPIVPHLFLYARNDDLVPTRDVEAFIALQRTRGVPVVARCFGRARHVALYPADPKRYRRELAAFTEPLRS